MYVCMGGYGRGGYLLHFCAVAEIICIHDAALVCAEEE